MRRRRTGGRGADGDAKLDEGALGPVVWQQEWREVPEGEDAPADAADADGEEGEAHLEDGGEEAREAVHARRQPVERMPYPGIWFDPSDDLRTDKFLSATPATLKMGIYAALILAQLQNMI